MGGDTAALASSRLRFYFGQRHPDMERIPESVADAIHDAVNALQVAILLAATIDRRAQRSMSGPRDPDQAELRRAINRAVTALATLKLKPGDR